MVANTDKVKLVTKRFWCCTKNLLEMSWNKLSGMSLPGWLRDCSQLIWSLVDFLSSLHERCWIVCKHSPTTIWTVVKLWKEWHKKTESLCLQSKSCAFEKCWLQRSDKISTLKVRLSVSDLTISASLPSGRLSRVCSVYANYWCLTSNQNNCNEAFGTVLCTSLWPVLHTTYIFC